MDSHRKATAIAITNVADTALYFDHVVPLGAILEVVHRVRPLWDEPDREKLFRRIGLTPDVERQLLPPELRSDKKFHTQRQALFVSEIEMIRRWLTLHRQGQHTSELNFNSWLREVRTVVRKFGLTDAPIILHDDLLPPSQDNPGTCFAATMTSIQMVDTTKLSWDHILEFRKDPASRLKLRRLRLLFAENYAGKDRLYVEDDLHRRLDDYSQVVRDWGFETRAQVISMLLRSKWLAGGAGGSIISALAGAPLTALVAASGSIVVEAANLVLEIVKRRHALANLARENPVSYISDLAKMAKPNPCDGRRSRAAQSAETN